MKEGALTSFTFGGVAQW